MESEFGPEAAWEIWSQDNFDLECPRQIDLAGRGLVKGLTELWARHLFETVRPNGQLGFTRFNLWWKQKGCSIEIMGEEAGQARLRQWIFGNRRSTSQGYMGIADKKMLEAVAVSHCSLILANQTSEAIFAAAKTSAGKKDFEARLSRLAVDM